MIAALLTLAVAAVAPPAEAAKRKPMGGTFDLFLPVPYPAENSSGSHCQDAPEPYSKFVQRLTVPAPGKYTLTLRDVVGDWVVEIYDARGTRIGLASTMLADAATVSFKNKRAGKVAYTIMICNYTGGPRGIGQWLYVFA